MVEPIVARETVVAQARAAANGSQNVHVANPYPPLTEAHALWELSFRLAADEVEVGSV